MYALIEKTVQGDIMHHTNQYKILGTYVKETYFQLMCHTSIEN